MQNLQYDVLSVQARDLLPVLLALVDDGPLKQKLSAWDCRYTPTSTEATLFQHFYRHVVLQIFGNEQGIGWRRMFYLCTRMGYSTMVLTAIDRTLRKVTSSWWRGRSKKALVQKAAELAQQEPVRAVVGVQRVPLREPVFRQRAGRPVAGFPLAADRHAGLPRHAVSRASDDDGHARNHVRPDVPLCDRPGHRRSLDQSAGRPQ